ncbi:histidinol dehydrogenase [candidate division KSB1 bacterium]
MKLFKNTDELVKFWYDRGSSRERSVHDAVRTILSDVRRDGDSALLKYTRNYDGVELDSLKIDNAAIKSARDSLSTELERIFLQAAENIREFHRKQLPGSWTGVSREGVKLGQWYSPVESAGIYIPGGKAVYPSTVLMNVIPAQVAGVPRIAVVSPPCENGTAAGLVLACADLLGIDEIYAVGGAQAVGALAFGTESVKPVVKITGPGNKYVNEAKLQVFGKVGIDMPAGPTELVIYADKHAPIEYIIWDIFAQAEHDQDAKVALVTTAPDLPPRLEKALSAFLTEAERKDIIQASLHENGCILGVESVDQAVEAINRIAPEHLELLAVNAVEISQEIKNAGAIFLGNHTPNVVGDYWAGPNHTLPTSGAAKFASPLGVLDFMKFSSLTAYSQEGMRRAAADIAAFARAEKLYAHARSAEVRNE